jgi:hypothetical protein
MKILPVEYHYEFYSSPNSRHPFQAFRTNSALGNISKGDFFDWRGFQDFPIPIAESSRVRIEGVEHIVWEIENDHIGHKTMFVIEIIQDLD